MMFGLSYNTGVYGTDPDQMIAAARHAEQCGFESFYLPEHIALYPGAAVGPVAFPPGGRLTAQERAAQLDLMRQTARAAGRDPAALQVTRWGSIDMIPDDVARHAEAGVTRLVVGPAATDTAAQLDEISAFAARLSLS
jgi:alkanesulfonate monooxygenase SsuD/methylene tetrahydromethanopterin reductase-like flavin-dependent oxidoreductase (luciferase family)